MSGSARTTAISGRPAAPGVRGSFLTLFNVRFQHDYYNAAGGSCPDFAVTPSPDCAKLMASLGMIFRDFGAGFAVAIDQARIPALIAYLGAQYGGSTPGAGYWTRLGFVLSSTNPDFVGITRLPITTSPIVQNLYASNLATSTAKGQILLDGTLAAGQSLYPLSGSTLSVATPAGGAATLADISGAAVAVPTTSNGATTSFAMSGLPYGLYTVVLPKPKARKARASATASSNYLLVSGNPISFGLIDLLLTQPTPGQGDAAAFPVAPIRPQVSGAPAPLPAVQSVALTLPFRSRSTYWNYYICSHDRTGSFAPGLKISGTGTSFTQSVEQLPNGDSATVFAAADALPLRQVSPYRFQLSGKRQGSGGGRDAVGVPWLPAAAASPVWPSAGDPLAGRSEIYVYV